jgi:hypothetical protein
MPRPPRSRAVIIITGRAPAALALREPEPALPVAAPISELRSPNSDLKGFPMRFPFLALLSALLWILTPAAHATADELAVEHTTTTPYRVGDMVAVPDLDGEVFPLQIIALRLAEGIAEFRTRQRAAFSGERTRWETAS